MTSCSLISSEFTSFFCVIEYILPPIDCIPKIIEQSEFGFTVLLLNCVLTWLFILTLLDVGFYTVTGITDEFLRLGGNDPYSGKTRGAAREFRDVYLDFQKFCNEKKNGRQLVFVAHNAKFDIRMINGELKRLRFSAQSESVPMLGDTFQTSLDTLQLFRHTKMWGTGLVRNPNIPRPSSFKLPELYSYIFHEPISNSHNAVGDIKATERLLLSVQFIGWKSIANDIQEPFVRIVPAGEVNNLS